MGVETAIMGRVCLLSIVNFSGVVDFLPKLPNQFIFNKMSKSPFDDSLLSVV